LKWLRALSAKKPEQQGKSEKSWQAGRRLLYRWQSAFAIDKIARHFRSVNFQCENFFFFTAFVYDSAK